MVTLESPKFLENFKDVGRLEHRAWGHEGRQSTLTSMGCCDSSQHLGTEVSEPGFGRCE